MFPERHGRGGAETESPSAAPATSCPSPKASRSSGLLPASRMSWKMSPLFVSGGTLGGTGQLQQVRRQQPRASPPCPPPPPPLLSLPPPALPSAAPRAKGWAQGKQPRDSAPNPKLLDSCFFLTETAWVFMGLFYVKSWRISGETFACKRERKSLRDGDADLEGEEGKLCWRNGGVGGAWKGLLPPLPATALRSPGLSPEICQRRKVTCGDESAGSGWSGNGIFVNGKHFRKSFLNASLVPINMR